MPIKKDGDKIKTVLYLDKIVYEAIQLESGGESTSALIRKILKDYIDTKRKAP